MRKTAKAQSLLEYLIVLTAIVVAIVAHTFAHLGVQPGRVNALGYANALDQISAKNNELVHRDYTGTTPDMSAQSAQWYADNPAPVQ